VVPPLFILLHVLCNCMLEMFFSGTLIKVKTFECGSRTSQILMPFSVEKKALCEYYQEEGVQSNMIYC